MSERSGSRLSDEYTLGLGAAYQWWRFTASVGSGLSTPSQLNAILGLELRTLSSRLSFLH